MKDFYNIADTLEHSKGCIVRTYPVRKKLSLRLDATPFSRGATYKYSEENLGQNLPIHDTGTTYLVTL